MPHYRRFSDCSVSEKILDSMFLITMGVGYLFALAHLYYTHQGLDGKPGISVEDIRIAYYGTHQQTRLGAALNGPMEGNLEYPEQKQVFFDWIEHGAKVDEFNAKVAPILNKNCIMCHSPDSGLSVPPLTSYEEVMKVAQTDTGASVQSLVRVSHIHMFGVAFIFFFVGRIFILCEMQVRVKRITVAIPFIAILLDIFSWYLTKLNPGFAYLVISAGALMGVSLAVQIFVPLYQMWIARPKVEPIEM